MYIAYITCQYTAGVSVFSPNLSSSAEMSSGAVTLSTFSDLGGCPSGYHPALVCVIVFDERL